MQFEHSIIEIRPRGLFELLDLAQMFYREHFFLLFPLAALFATPAVLLGLGLHAWLAQTWLSLAAFWLLLPLSSGAGILAASRLVFGVPMDLRRTAALYKPMMMRNLAIAVGQRIVWLPLLPLLAGWVIRLYWAFTPMVLLLEKLEGPALRLRRRSLYRRGGTNAFGLDFTVACVAAVALAALAVVCDFVLSDIVSLWETGGLVQNIAASPLKLATWMLVALVVLPLIDLTWFFYYLNARIRKEGWDIELGFRAAASRLEADLPGEVRR